MAEIVRLVTTVDLDDRRPDKSARAHLYGVLADGQRVALLTDRGWGGSAGLASRSVEEVEQTARMVVGPDGAARGESIADVEAAYWQDLFERLQRMGISATPVELQALPHDVELADRLANALA